MFFTLLFILFVSLLNYCALQKHELSSSHMRLGPRYQILKEFGFTGQKNVRYETRPIEFQDVQGKYYRIFSFGPTINANFYFQEIR